MKKQAMAQGGLHGKPESASKVKATGPAKEAMPSGREKGHSAAFNPGKLSVESHGAYGKQAHASQPAQKLSLGFPTGKTYNGSAHFSQEKFLRQGHNDSGSADIGDRMMAKIKSSIEDRAMGGGKDKDLDEDYAQFDPSVSVPGVASGAISGTINAHPRKK